MNEHFLDLFRYNAWATQNILDVLKSLVETAATDDGHAAALSEALGLMSHIQRAEIIWMDRIHGQGTRVAVWESDALAVCIERAEAHTRAWMDLVAQATAEDFERPIHYTSTKGTPYTSTLRQIATHIVNHGTHHRGQITRLLRQASITPPLTDYIFYAR